MLCRVDGKETDCKKIIYRDLGYGSDTGAPVFDIEIEIEIPIHEAKEKFYLPINDFIEQCRIDDNKGKEISIPEVAALNYPSAESLFNYHKDLLSQIIFDYIYFDILNSLFSINPSEMWRFSVNIINSVEIYGNVMQISCKGYAIRAQE